MNNIRNFKSRNVEMPSAYLTDESLEKLIAEIEAEPLLHPPKEFQNEILDRIHRKKKHMKDRALFSYSMKVITATAAALCIVLTVPENLRSQEKGQVWIADEEMEKEIEKEIGPLMEKGLLEKDYEAGFSYRFNRQLNEYCMKLNGKLNQIVRMEVNFDEKEKE